MFLSKGAETLALLSPEMKASQRQADKESTRDELKKLTREAAAMEALIKANLKYFKDAAKKDQSLQKVLDKMSTKDPTTQMLKALKDGSGVSRLEAVDYTKYLEDLVERTKKVDAAIEVSNKKMVEGYRLAVADNTRSRDERREAIEQLKKNLTQSTKGVKLSEESTKALEKLQSIETKSLNFTTKEVSEFSKLTKSLGDDVLQIKTYDTLEAISATMDKILLTEKGMKTALEEGGQKSLKSRVTEGKTEDGSGVLGLASKAFGSLGFGKISKIFETVETVLGAGGKEGGMLLRLAKGLGSVAKVKFGPVIELGQGLMKAVGFLGEGGGILARASKIFGGASRILGKAALPIAIAMGIFDFFQGFSNASKITGIDEKKLKMTDKIRAGIASVFSGLTLGFVSPEEMFHFMDSSVKRIKRFFKPENLLKSLSKIGTLLWEMTPIGMAMKLWKTYNVGKKASDLLDKAWKGAVAIWEQTPIGRFVAWAKEVDVAGMGDDLIKKLKAGLDAVANFFLHPIDTMKAMLGLGEAPKGGGVQELGSKVTSAASGAASAVSSAGSAVASGVSNTASAVSQGYQSGGIKGAVSAGASTVGSGLGGAFKSAFGGALGSGDDAAAGGGGGSGDGVVGKVKGFIKKMEGFRSSPYWDFAGYSEGYGHLVPGSTKGHPPPPVTKAQADALFDQDFEKHKQPVDKMVAGLGLSEEQKAALYSFAYNAGPGAIVKSGILSKLKAGDFAGAGQLLSHTYTKAGGKVLPGLVQRRGFESSIFMSGTTAGGGAQAAAGPGRPDGISAAMGQITEGAGNAGNASFSASGTSGTATATPTSLPTTASTLGPQVVQAQQAAQTRAVASAVSGSVRQIGAAVSGSAGGGNTPGGPDKGTTIQDFHLLAVANGMME